MNHHDCHYFPTPLSLAGQMSTLLSDRGGRVIAPAPAACETKSFVLPALWERYLLHGDTSSLHLSEEQELAMINMIEDWTLEQGLDACIQVRGKPFFCWVNDGPMTLACTCKTYTFTMAA